METLLTLAKIIGRAGNAEAIKLRPAMFLAQEWSGVTYYDFRVGQGLVFSDQLDQDLSQLVSGGLVLQSSPAVGSEVTFSPQAQGVQAAQVLSEEESKLVSSIVTLLKESTSVLDAAATSRFFERKRLGDPGEWLQWYRALPDPDRERAGALAPGSAA